MSNHYSNSVVAATKRELAWATMLTDDSAKQVYAPSLTPELLSKATFVQSRDVHYADSPGGYSVVVLSPNPHDSLALQTTAPRLPLAGSAGIGGSTPLKHPTIVTDDSATFAGLVSVGLENAAATYEVSSQTVNAAGSPAHLFAIHTDAVASGFYVKPSIGLRLRVIRWNGAALEPEASVVCPAGVMTSLPNAFATARDYFGFQACTSAGVAQQPPEGTSLEIAYHTTGHVDPTLPGSVYGLVSAELLEQGNVSHYRCTAMNLLITNMASLLDGAGEVVIGRVPKATLIASSSQELMNQIKRLPQKSLWSSRNLLDGAYAWYLPDDLDSYETRAISDSTSDNVLVAVVHMANANGQYRINATWRMEFYTPAQILSREFTHPWTPCSMAMFNELATKEATSANIGHMALIAGIASAAKMVYEFYVANASVINPVAKTVYSLAANSVKKKAEVKAKQPKQQVLKTLAAPRHK